ncbi:MAG: PAS domain S-box protein, partial [Candidatus Zixiibacteriota bacterium]
MSTALRHSTGESQRSGAGSTEMRRRLPTGERWLYAHKLFTYLLVIGSLFLFLGSPSTLRSPALIYSLLTLYLPLTAFWSRLRFPDPFHRVAVMMQLIFELIVVIGIIYLSGAEFSLFTGLLYLTIISGALTFNLVGALTIATMAMAGHLFVSWFAGGAETGFSDGRAFWEAIKQAPDDKFFSSFLQALSFYLIAFVAGFFSERLQSQGRQLSDTSRALSRARLQTDVILQRLTTGLLTVDFEGKVTLFNESAETILGLDADSVRERDFRETLGGRVAELGRELQLVFETGVNRPRREVRITQADGSVVPLGVSTAATSDSYGEGTCEDSAQRESAGRGVIAIFQDITEVKEMQEKARQSDRLMAVAELSAAIAHEIRNPLAAIAGSVQVLGDELALEGEEAELFDLILTESS